MMPPLPEPSVMLDSYVRNPITRKVKQFTYFNESQILAYGKACRAQALAEAAALCDNEKWDHQTGANSIRFIDTYNGACDDCAKAIGRLV